MVVSSTSNVISAVSFDALCERAKSGGLAVRGAFHPEPREFEALLPGVRAETIILLGFTGSLQWQDYRSSVEANDGLPDPLDRWSRRIIGALAADLGGLALYPSG